MLSRVLSRIWSLARRVAAEGEMRDEMQFHLDRSTERLVTRGLTPEAARAQARREFGNVTAIQEDARDARGIRWFVDAAQDWRIALRQIRRSPALAVAIVLTLGVGLGTSTAIFTVSKTALLDPLPYAEPDRLLLIREARAEELTPTSYPTLLDWRSRATSFRTLDGYDPANMTVGLGDEARMVRGAAVTTGFFRTLGVPMVTGRDFLANEDSVSGTAVAIVSDRFARLIANDGPVSRVITVNGSPHTIIGVLPRSFHFALLQDADIFTPLIVNGARRTDRFDRSITVVGRLQDGVELGAARRELTARMADLEHEHPDALAGRTIRATPLRDALIGGMKPVLAGLLFAVILLTATMGANLALLMLMRLAGRAPELSMRAALGATRGRTIRQLLVESLVPTAGGAVLAIAIGQVATGWLIDQIPAAVRIGMPYLEHAALDRNVFLVIGAVAVSLAVAFGVGPALFITRTSGRSGDRRATSSRSDRQMKRSLVIGQMALTVVLLVSAGLLVVSFRNIVHREIGVGDPDRIVIARAPLSGPRFREEGAQQNFYEQLLATVGSSPGIRAAGAVDEVPGGGQGITTFEAVDAPRARSMQPRAGVRIVGGQYFEAMGIRTVAGRVFDARDRGDAAPVVVISASLAKVLLADGTTLGRRLRFAATSDVEWEVVGIVGDVQTSALDERSPPVVYLSHLQRAENRMTLVMRTDIGVAAVTRQIRDAVEAIDPGVPVYAVTTLGQQLSDSRAVFSRRLPMILCGAFAVAAALLTLMALYAICMHDVVARRREFGIRLALGGSARAIQRLIFGDAIWMGIAGSALGAIVSIIVARAMHSLLFGIAPTDWRIYGAVVIGVLVCSILATLSPALRAGSVNPGVIMRGE